MRVFRVFRDEGDGSGSTNPEGEAAKTEGTNVVEKTGWLAGVKDSIFEAHKDELGKHSNVNTVLEDYFNQKEKMSSAIVKPGKDASEEEVKAYNERMGIPSDEESYELSEAPEGASKSEEFDKAFKELALKVGLDKEQAKGFHFGLKSLEAAGVKAKAESDKKAMEETTKAMKNLYGDNYNSVMTKVTKIINLGGEGFQTFLKESQLGNDPRMVKALAALGDIISEDSLIRKQGGQSPVKKSVAERLYPTQGKDKK